QAAMLSALQARLDPILGDELSGQCRVAGLRDGRLILGTPSPAWSTRVRYHTAEIIRKAQAEGLQVSECHIVVLKDHPSPAVPARPRPTLSMEAARQIESSAA